MSVVNPNVRFTYEDYRSLPESMEKRYELLDGDLLVVEILSPGTEERDRGYKKALYARYGVQECWIVDPVTRTIEIHVPSAEGIELRASFQKGEILTSHLLRGLQLDTSEVFAQE